MLQLVSYPCVGYTSTADLSVIYPKVPFRWENCVLTPSGQPGLSEGIAYGIWTQSGGWEVSDTHSLGDSVFMTHISVKKVFPPTEKPVFVVPELLSHQK